MPVDDERLVRIEITLAEHERMLDELSEVMIEQSKKIDKLLKQNKFLLEKMQEDPIKPQSEETPPPHY